MKNAVQSSAFHLGDICMKLMIKKEKVEIRREKKKRNEKDYVKVSRDLEYLIFFLKKLLWGPMKVKFRHLWPRWS